MTIHKIFFLFLIHCAGATLVAQELPHFQKEVNALVAGDSLVNKKKLILFTGSSSIRLWKELKTDFPKKNVLNRGFGGSDMADLLFHATPLIINYKPSVIVIYEGDNDISAGKTPEEILADAEKIVTLIRLQLSPNVKIIFISAKPSVARWQLKTKYEEYNRQLKQWTATKKNVLYADVWTPMLDTSGEVRKDLFIEDNLHMNRTGYEIWKKVIAPYLR
jgi:lysophospholipase L1-like esterase